MSQVTVSVVMITYGHELYISEAIEGVLKQENNFEYELIISNDCSPDATEIIVKNIIQNHEKGHLIRYFCQKKNIGMMPNFIFAIKQCKGKYIAFCEGDDYWTDFSKISKQVDFLEKNLSYVISTHKTNELHKNKIFTDDWRWNKKKVAYTIPDYLYQLFFHTSSVVYRNMAIPDYLSSPEILHGDIALFSYVLAYGKLYYFENAMSVYRKHTGGISNSLKHKNFELQRNSKIFILKELNVITKFKFQKIIKSKIRIEKNIYLMNTAKPSFFYKIIYWINNMHYKYLFLTK